MCAKASSMTTTAFHVSFDSILGLFFIQYSFLTQTHTRTHTWGDRASEREREEERINVGLYRLDTAYHSCVCVRCSLLRIIEYFTFGWTSSLHFLHHHHHLVAARCTWYLPFTVRLKQYMYNVYNTIHIMYTVCCCFSSILLFLFSSSSSLPSPAPLLLSLFSSSHFAWFSSSSTA